MVREHLGSELEIKNWVMEIADNLIPSLINRNVDSEGQPFRYMSVQNVDVRYEMQGEVHQINTSIHYLTEGEDFNEELIIRYFDSIYNFTLEKTQYEKLLARTEVFGNIEPVDRIHLDEEERLIIYKAPAGVILEDLSLPLHLMSFQMGVIMGILHGGYTSKLILDNYKDMAAYLVNHLPFDEPTREEILNGLGSEFDLLQHSYAGYEPLTLMDLKHIRFAPLEDSITKGKILNGDAFYIEILPSLVIHQQMDRMEDFATLFGELGFIEYQSNGVLSKTISMLIDCMEGYESYFVQYSTAPMDRIYPEGLSLDLHMLMGIWLIALSNIEKGEAFNPLVLAEYSKYVLKNNSFQIYD